MRNLRKLLKKDRSNPISFLGAATFAIALSLFFTSCRCLTEYETAYAKASTDTTVVVSARLWQGNTQNLTLTVEIHRPDSYFVKDVIFSPNIRGISPHFTQYSMFSFYPDGGTTGWQDYYADTFSSLPAVNRITMKDGLYVKYQADYEWQDKTRIRNFTTEVTVILNDKFGNEHILTRNMTFSSNRKCGVGP